MQVILTKDWNEPLPGATAATDVLAQLESTGTNATQVMNDLTSCDDGKKRIMGLDALFRRHQSGFSAIKSLVGTVVNHENELPEATSILCGCNVLVYSFLVGAKNFDFILPEYEDQSISSYHGEKSNWLSAIKQLENFERDGVPMTLSAMQESYLQIRPVMIRRSARDEHRSLCNLLISGPSSMSEISRDLALPYTLSDRVLAPFISAGIVELSANNNHFRIRSANVALALFLVRETLGVAPLDILAV